MYERTRFMQLRTYLVVSVFALSFSQGDCPASPANWGDGFLLQTEGGIVNPAMLVAFNPQPEPPAWTGETLSAIVSDDQGQKVLEQKVTEVSNPDQGLQNFQFLFGVASNAGPIRSVAYPPDPINDFRITFSIIQDVGGVPADFSVIVDVQSSSGGLMSPDSAVAFNPQPEPPALGLGGFETYGLDFGVNSLSDVTLRLRVEDGEGNSLNLRAVPEPASAALIAFATATLVVLRPRRVGKLLQETYS